jgi:hypothetical protein
MLSVPQGLNEEQFANLSAKVFAGAGHWGQDIRVQGSRAGGTARSDSDLDLAILVSPERFEQILHECFRNVNPNTAKARTMQRARETGKIQTGEAKLRSLRKALEADLGVEVDISIIREGGPFDQAPYLPLIRPEERAGNG